MKIISVLSAFARPGRGAGSHLSRLLAALTLGSLAALAPARAAESTAATAESATSEGVAWRTDYNDSLQEAAASKKNVLLRFTADWCPPCQIMNRNVWPVPDVQTAVSKGYIPVEIDVDRPASRPVAMRYGIRGIPTLVLIDPDENELARSGFASAPELIRFLESAGN